MNPPRSAAIYARISSDVEGTGAGVERQLADCRKLADSLGWRVGGEYVDNDISAYSGKRRPAYEQMMADLADGTVDAVLIYHLDRLTRRPIELEQFYTAVTAAKVQYVRFVSGDMNLNTDHGLMMARMLGTFAAAESADKSRRVRRKLDQVAAEGRPHGGMRAYGYAADKITIVPEEAAVIRTLAARFLAGESSRSLAGWLEDQEIPTVSGKPWRTLTIKNILTGPRIAGLREHRGEVVGPAVWEAIISEDDHRKIEAKYQEKKISGRRIPQRYLLSGLLRCSRCSNRLFSSPRKHVRRYVCLSGPDHGGCGRMTVVADPLERMIADAVLYRLDTPELADALAGRNNADERTRELSRTVDQAQEKLEELAQAYAQDQIKMREWMIARTPIEQRLTTASRQLAAMTSTTALSGLVGHGAQLGRSWQELNLSRQHSIVAAVIDHIAIEPGQAGARSVDRGRVHIVWRL